MNKEKVAKELWEAEAREKADCSTYVSLFSHMGSCFNFTFMLLIIIFSNAISFGFNGLMAMWITDEWGWE